MNSEKWCDCCEISTAEYNYADGEYMGNDDEYGEDEIVKSIADYLGIEKIK